MKNPELAGKGVARNTFALFMEPSYSEVLSIPKGIPVEEVTEKKAYKIPALKDRWSNGITFKDFHQTTIKYYS